MFLKTKNPQNNSLKKDLNLPIVISEVKKQGTNNKRITFGKPKQATGNAVERLGKNLTAVRTMFHYHEITPFICFFHGCDFLENTVLAKLSVLNVFHALNTEHVYKKCGLQPVTFYTSENAWSEEEMAERILRIARVSITASLALHGKYNY